MVKDVMPGVYLYDGLVYGLVRLARYHADSSEWAVLRQPSGATVRVPRADFEAKAELQLPVVENVPLGVYVHKGGEYYLVVDVVEIDGEPEVHYVPLYIREDRLGLRTSIRTPEDFLGNFEYFGPGYKDDNGPGDCS